MSLLSRCRVASCALFLLLAVAPAPAADALPRYKLQVGQELQYTGHTEFKYDGGKFLDDTDARVWVVRQNDDGSWRVIIRVSTNHRQEVSRSVPSKNERINFAWCDLSPDGEIKDNDSLGFQMSIRHFLPRLPTSQDELASGWSVTEPKTGYIYRYRIVKDGSSTGEAVIEAVRESPENAIYGFEFKDTVTFDCVVGLPEKIDSFHKQTFGFNGEGKGKLSLGKVRMHTAEWCKDFLADAERYFAIAENEPVGSSPEALENRWEVIAEKRRAAKDKIKSPDILKQIDNDVAKHAENAKYSLDSAKERFAILDQAAAEWVCKDLAGKDHSLADYRGRVVVLDFWYRGCGWCIRAMPQVKEVAAHFKDQPVAIFGMNTDRKDEDAQFVIDALALNYETLKAEGIPQKYNVRGFPTLIIIDQEGTVRDLHVGYSPELKAKIIESIERLLAEKP